MWLFRLCGPRRWTWPDRMSASSCAGSNSPLAPRAARQSPGSGPRTRPCARQMISVPEWTTVARTGELSEGEMTGGTIAGEEVLVVNLRGQYRAVGATCTHAGCSLVDDGEIDESTLTCGCHGSIFDLESGEA